jgi:anti-sigma B factor antagonist
MVDHSAEAADSTASAQQDGLEVRKSLIGPVVVLSVRDEIDMLSAPRLTEAIRYELDKAPAGLIVDLSDVQFLASAGMSVLVAAQEQAGTSTRFGVVADGPATSRPIKLLGVDGFLSLYPTLDDALRDFR